MENPYPINDIDEIKRMVLAGDKIGAIKLYRERTGAGLAESKAAIEQLLTQLRGFESVDSLLPKPAPDVPLPHAAITEALFAGRKIQAVKLYREQNRVGLAEAKRAVDELETRLRESAPGLFTKASGKGCLVPLFFGAFAGAALWKWLA